MVTNEPDEVIMQLEDAATPVMLIDLQPSVASPPSRPAAKRPKNKVRFLDL